jgi:asparagine synthase (glutamine-hydrolysing)
MCGISGIVRRDRPVASAELQALNASLAHRGPDDAGTYLAGTVGLAQTRLSIIDIVGGHQPILSRDRQLAVVANGEIYNYRELNNELAAAGREFSTRSDSETILHAYAVYGLEFVRRLHGMFAFALHDAQAGRVILARDRFGMKPLYYLPLPDGVVFASELKALRPLLPGPPEVEPAALIQYLQNQFNTGEQTILRGIRRLLPGELLVIDRRLDLRRERYWNACEVRPAPMDFDQACVQFEPLIEQVMMEHVRSDVPYGLFLSGGVDSAVLLALLRRYQDKPVRTFSVGYRDVKMADELEDAERIAREFGADHTSLRIDRDSLFARLPYTVWAADDLMRDYASLPTSMLAQMAAQELKVVFSGEGGDEAFAGYGRYREPAVARLVKSLLAPGSGGFRVRGHWRGGRARRVFGPRLRAVRSATRAPFVAAWQSTPPGWSDLMRRQYTDLVTALPDNLMVKADRMLMAFGLEGRLPFLDHRVVEFGLALPDELKTDGRQGKLFLKRWAERFLPIDHLYRRKRGFHVPVGEWLQGGLLERIADRLPDNAGVRAWFRPEGVRDLLMRQRSRRDSSREVWSLMQFAIWHRLFIEGEGAPPPVDDDPVRWL